MTEKTDKPAPAWKGLNTDSMPVFIGYDQAERMVAALLDRAAAWHPDSVVGIARGGLVPATMASCMLALPLAIAGWDRAEGIMRWIGPAAQGPRVLLVDDCSATGTTLRAARDWLLAQDFQVMTLTIVHDPETTALVPDLSHPMRALFRLPWERGEATPTARARRTLGKPAERETEAPFFGLDLDGVFLPDVPRALYQSDLQAALSHRQSLEPFTSLPLYTAGRAVVITGRPESDRVVTQSWLEQWGFGALPLECRPLGVGERLEEVARYKAETATRWGCTHFIESEAEQAVRIAAMAKHLVVSWWSAEDARAWLIGAAEQG